MGEPGITEEYRRRRLTQSIARGMACSLNDRSRGENYKEVIYFLDVHAAALYFEMASLMEKSV